MHGLISWISRLFFIGAFILAVIAVWEKIANWMDLTLLRGYAPSRLLEFASILLIFVIAMQVREIKAMKEIERG